MMGSSKESSSAYTAATSRLREKYRDEFNDYLVQEHAKRGMEWTPKPTEAQKAKAEIEKLIAAHPELRDLFVVGADPANTEN